MPRPFVRSGGLVLLGWLGAVAGPAAAQGGSYHFRTDPIAWTVCTDALIDGLECATYAVPLDYRDKGGATLTLALRRMPATGTAKGSLFFNPGGPGGTGTLQFPQWYGLFPQAVRENFDIVSWDPRGIGQSTRAQCYANGDEEAAVIGAFEAFPATYAEQAAWRDGYTAFSRACADRTGDVLSHLSTADVARDLEQLRLASGGAPLNYWGVSYGTILGATYANLFPDNIRSLVLDGNLSPQSWTAGGDPNPQWPLGDRIGSYRVAEVFEHFLQLCTAAGPDACAFAEPSLDLTRQKWTDLLNRLSRGPIELRTKAGPRTITLAGLVGKVSDGMDIVWPVPGASGWVATAEALQTLHETAKSPPPAPARPETARPDSKPAPYEGAEGVIAVMCGDAPTVTLDRFPTLASEAMLRSGHFGLATSFAEFPCSTWTIRAADPYSGPWNTPLSARPLVVNTTHDPSTPMPNAEEMIDALPGAVLLRVNGYGHTTLLNPSTCANDRIAAYLTEGTLPPPDTFCAKDRQPFEQPDGAATK